MITKYSISPEDVASIHVYIMKEIKAQKMVNTGFTNFVPYVNANEQENKTGRKIG